MLRIHSALLLAAGLAAIASAGPCETWLGQCQAEPNANLNNCQTVYEQCLSSGDETNSAIWQTTSCTSYMPGFTPPPETYTTAPWHSGQGQCWEQRHQCESQPNSNEAQCAASFASCISTATIPGSPITLPPGLNSWTTTFPAVSAPTSWPANGAGMGVCQGQLESCQLAPNANQGFCSSQYDSCLSSSSAGFFPTSGFTTFQFPSGISTFNFATSTSSIHVGAGNANKQPMVEAAAVALGGLFLAVL